MWKLMLLAVARLAHAECPNWCSQMGICSGPGSDAHCICNPGHTGDDCSLLHCPRGPDWRAEGNASRAIRLQTDAVSGRLDGFFTFTFHGETVRLPADANTLSADKCSQLVSSLASVGRARF